MNIAISQLGKTQHRRHHAPGASFVPFGSARNRGHSSWFHGQPEKTAKNEIPGGLMAMVWTLVFFVWQFTIETN
jgi:hypothetical protein